MLRYAVTMQAGYEKDLYKKDYAKALFRLINNLDKVDSTDVEFAKGRFDDDNQPLVDVLQNLFSKHNYRDSMNTLATSLNNLNKYNKYSDPKADAEWRKSVKDYEAHTGKKITEDDEDKPLRGVIKPDTTAPSKTAPVYLQRAQNSFSVAIAQAGYDLNRNLNRATVNAKAIGVLRNSIKDFKWENTIKSFNDLNSLHVIFFETWKNNKKSLTKKIYIRSKKGHKKTKRNHLKIKA